MLDQFPPSAARRTIIRLANPTDALAIALVHAQCWHETYVGLLPDEFLANATAEHRLLGRQQVLADPSVTSFVAEHQSEIVAFADCGPYRGCTEQSMGEVYAIYVLKSAQGKGIGAELMSCCATTLIEQGRTSLRLWCLEANARARGFYEASGGKVVGCRETSRGALHLAEVEYQWDFGSMERLALACTR